MGEVFHQDNVVAEIAPCGATIKDLQLVAMNSTDTPSDRDQTENIVMFDDKPQNIKGWNGKKYGVKPYHDGPLFKNVMDVIRMHDGLHNFVMYKWVRLYETLK